MNRFLVYTCLVGDYDWLLPPVVKDGQTDYVVFTDNPSLNVEGWRVVSFDVDQFSSPLLASRYYKMLGHHLLPEKHYQASVYVDANIRLLGRLSSLIEGLLASEAALCVFRHPLRETVIEEIHTTTTVGKAPGEASWLEYKRMQEVGFDQQVPLIEATIMIKNHCHHTMHQAMECWWEWFKKYSTRDQHSLPYAIWQTDLDVIFHNFSFREPNPYFAIYRHKWKAPSPLYHYLEGRSYDSGLHFLFFHQWRIYRAIVRD